MIIIEKTDFQSNVDECFNQKCDNRNCQNTYYHVFVNVVPYDMHRGTPQLYALRFHFDCV